MSILPLLNPKTNKEWILLIGKYMLNMGAIETTSRMIIVDLNGTDQVKIFSAPLSDRIKYLRSRYPKEDGEKYSKVMKFFDTLSLHVNFRNIVAHSGIMYKDSSCGKKKIVGLLNLQPNDKNNIGEIISIEEMKGRVNESSKLGSTLLELQNEFTDKV